MMALPQGPWSISKEDLEAAINAPPMPSFYDAVVRSHLHDLNEGVRRALCLWVSELEPELMFRVGQSRPFGVTAKGHCTPYIEIKWDDNFYLTGEPIRHQVSRSRPEGK
ncbi:MULTISPECIES: hypothetical protein [unclassified Bradyrhizobium]|uniref:hypothetical protein n=1 Tax=unclassified Bradyrhizobium TaxID=2631580 RepID=UPI001FF80B64|nr:MULTISPECIES: hypothetical protein [unclassified Bradyrhizobium]MCK1536854.1 hypothetical protein [Bradyrhizobium sp. 176]MCK1560157.1 hypothetical protein [Bradyrhizobium sp. 171]